MFPLLLVLLGGVTPPAEGHQPKLRSQAPEGFWDHWGDGQAELSGYELVQPRYGELRHGEAVLVYVTETFTHAQRVKSDGGHDDEYPVLKLNEVRDFPTGIYDYNAMTSSFVRLDGQQALGVPTKVSFSMQEWCGHVWDQLTVDKRRYERVGHSYFDGEGDRNGRQSLPEDGVFADSFPIVVRGLAGELVAPGETRDVPWLPRFLDTRMQHRELAWTTATLTRAGAPESVDTPLGAIDAWRWTVEADGVTTDWFVEDDAPHRLVKWTASTGEEARITGTYRTPYWQQNRDGDEQHRSKLGLGPLSHAPGPALELDRDAADDLPVEDQ